MEYEELKSYLKDVYEAEQQLFTLQKLADLYENEIEKINDECMNVYGREALLEGEINPYDTRARLIPPDFLYKEENPYKAIIGGKKVAYARRWGTQFWKDTSELLHRFEKGFLFWKHIPSDTFKQGSEYSNLLIEYYAKCYYKDLEAKRNYLLPIGEKTTKEYTEIILETLSTSKKLLEKLYSQNIIHPKYRNLLAIAQIYEYLDTSRCTELGGPNGAYNLYEQELRQNIIIDKLDEIIYQLDNLNRTMSYVSSAITTTNRLLGNISSTLGRIEANTALTAYNSQCIAYNTNLANRYNY